MSDLLPLYLTKIHRDVGFDVIAYKSPDCVKPMAHWPWYHRNRPDKRNKYVMFDCYKRHIVWLDDVNA